MEPRSDFFLVPWPYLSYHYLHLEDGATVRFVSALVAPVFPLVVFLCCLLVEVAKPGLGIAGGLQDPGCSGGCKGDEVRRNACKAYYARRTGLDSSV